MSEYKTDDTERGWLRGFGALSDTDIPEKMRNVRKRLRDEWPQNTDTEHD